MAHPCRRRLKYAKLRQQRTIRLLILLPGTEEDEIACEFLTNVSIGEHRSRVVEYSALSYLWGDPAPVATISIDNRTLRVARELHMALRALRDGSSKRTMWIDAICINQADKKERAEQVKLMDDIYNTAIRTVLWLGPAADNSDLAMDFILSHAGDLMTWTPEGPSAPDYDAEPQELVRAAELFANIARDPRYAGAWQALFALLARRYWTRMWIIQEIALSPDPMVCCGDRRVPWEPFQVIVQAVAAMVERREPGAPHVHALGPLLDRDSLPLQHEFERSYVGPRDAGWLAYSLRRYHRLGATDPRDKVWALLGLVDAPTRRVVRVDYDRPLRQVLTETFKLLVGPGVRRTDPPPGVSTTAIGHFSVTVEGEMVDEQPFIQRRHGPLNVLCSAGWAPSRRCLWRRRLPSWLPDWSAPRAADIDTMTHNSSRASTDLEPQFELRRRGRVLAVRGYELDAVGAVGAAVRAPRAGDAGSMDADADVDKAILDAVADWTCLAVTTRLGGGSVGDAAALWRALVMDAYPTMYFLGAPPEWDRMTLRALRGAVHGWPLDEQSRAVFPSEYLVMLRRTAVGRRCALTLTGGLFMMVPEETRAGDRLCILWGCDVPVILGKREGRLVLIGECWVDKVMDGTWIEHMKAAACSSEDGAQIFRIY